MPRTWRSEDANPLGLRVFHSKALECGGDSARSARALISSAVLAYPLPGIFHKNLLRDDDCKSGVDSGVIVLAMPSQNAKVTFLPFDRDHISSDP